MLNKYVVGSIQQLTLGGQAALDIADMPGKRIKELEMTIEAMQAKIDSLMLEYCPEEMTEGQMANWAEHQKLVKEII